MADHRPARIEGGPAACRKLQRASDRAFIAGPSEGFPGAANERFEPDSFAGAVDESARVERDRPGLLGGGAVDRKFLVLRPTLVPHRPSKAFEHHRPFRGIVQIEAGVTPPVGGTQNVRFDHAEVGVRDGDLENGLNASRHYYFGNQGAAAPVQHPPDFQVPISCDTSNRSVDLLKPGCTALTHRKGAPLDEGRHFELRHHESVRNRRGWRNRAVRSAKPFEQGITRRVESGLMTEPVLSGVRVLELGGSLSVAFAAKWLAGFGADVVRVDPDTETLTPDEQVYLLAGKRRVSASFAVESLALAADIVIEGDQLGSFLRRVNPAQLRRQKPSIVVVSITPYGQDGPYAANQATNITSFAMGGIMSLTGMAQREPLVTGGSQAQYLGGINGFGAAVTAYLGSLIHGEGDWVDISLQECQAGMLELYGPGGAVNGVPSVRAGNHVRASWGIYPCADGYAGVCALERQIPAFFKVVGDPELDEPRFRDITQRAANDDELQAKFYGWFAEHTKQEILDLGAQYKVPFGAVMTPNDLLGNASLAERHFFDAVDTPDGVAMIPGRPFLGLPWVPGELHAAGADTQEVMAEWLEHLS